MLFSFLLQSSLSYRPLIIKDPPPIYGTPKVTTSIKGPMAFGNSQDAANWLANNQIMDQSIANGFMARAQFAMKSKTKGYQFLMNHTPDSQSRQSNLICNIVSTSQSDGGLSVSVGTIVSSVDFKQMKIYYRGNVRLMSNVDFRPLNSTELSQMYGKLLDNAANSINEMASSL